MSAKYAPLEEDEEIKGHKPVPVLDGNEGLSVPLEDELPDTDSFADNHLNWRRVLYCMGAVSRVDNVIQNYYLNPFLLDVVGLKPSLTGNVLLIKQIWDAVTDPFVGYMSDHYRSRFGRRRPFIMLSAPVLWATWILLWLQLSTLDGEQLYLFLYYCGVLIVFNTANTCQMVPYKALLQDVAPTYGIRTKMVALQEMTAMFAFMGAVAIHGLIINAFTCGQNNYSCVEGDPNYKTGYIASALLFAPIIAIPRIFTSLVVVEKPVSEEEASIVHKDDTPLVKRHDENGIEIVEKKRTFDALLTFFRIWLQALRFKDFSLLSLSWLLANIVVSMATTNLILYIKYYLEEPDKGTLVVMFLQAGIALSLPVWAFIIRKIGKKRSLFLGCCMLTCMFVGLFFLQPGQYLVLFAVMPFAGICAGSLYICLSAMQPDCVEAYYLATGARYLSHTYISSYILPNTSEYFILIVLLPTTYHLLPTTYYLLSTTYYLLPSPSCFGREYYLTLFSLLQT
tara:strand:- start:137 stop:1663 length:1527 start_codon:yes stop_codon:yes gene_type:complete